MNPSIQASETLDRRQGRVLVRLARQTIAERLGLVVADPVRPDELDDPALQARRGVFVTLHRAGRLRGCIGSLVGVEPLVEGVRRNAVNAAFGDPRFPPLRPAEYPDLEVEVSVLSTPRPLPYDGPEDLLQKLRPGRDGVIIQAADGRRATFLPQVWAQLPQPRAFLSQLCRKAGLPEDAWLEGDLDVSTYQVQFFTDG